ncbi:hypothetical protein CN397_23975 [Priestia megaterium]|uniref:hypothetical protein n=1 Tax=Priestia megaterium TaxID=1404 RepID=UPI000BFAAD60|nr:hypothetical protein [Priestia megaterium]PEU68119.1 hypothetical protein CN397_23975 [Priestia megaterium]
MEKKTEKEILISKSFLEKLSDLNEELDTEEAKKLRDLFNEIKHKKGLDLSDKFYKLELEKLGRDFYVIRLSRRLRIIVKYTEEAIYFADLYTRDEMRRGFKSLLMNDLNQSSNGRTNQITKEESSG